jgi:hypothetical protein
MSSDLNSDAVYDIGVEAYTYLYPLVLMDVTRRQLTNVKQAEPVTRKGPPNVFVNAERFTEPTDYTVVRPNFDTLYSSAWLDLTGEPMVIGLGANLPEDAIYPTAYIDATSATLDSAKQYTLHFDADKLPPVNAFWSVTLYDEQGFQVPNEIERFSLGTRNAAKNADGSVTLYIQRDMPASDPQRANWLPAPQAGPFNLTMRLYSPKQLALDANWKPPGIALAS